MCKKSTKITIDKNCNDCYYGVVQKTNGNFGTHLFEGEYAIMIYGYCRISTPKQSIERQVRNILAV